MLELRRLMELTVSDEEAAALRRALESYLSDLRMEITDTERLDMRQRLKAEAELLSDLKRRLDAPDGVAADA